MKKITLSVLLIISMLSAGVAQSLEELKSQKAEKAAAKAELDAQAAAIAAEIATIDAAIKKFPSWTNGFTGLIGIDLNGSNDWFANPIPTFSSRGIGISANAFANYSADKNFWFNSLNASYGNTKVNNTLPDGTEEELTTEISPLVISSLGGFQIAGTIFASGKLGFETNFLEIDQYSKFTASAGATWKPLSNLVVFVHPLAYQLISPEGDFSSAAGADFGASYVGTIGPKIKWNSNLTGFLSYAGDDERTPALSASELSNWTWINSFIIDNLYKGIGVGLNVGLRGNKQLAIANGITNGDNPLQTYYTLGFSYAL